MYQPDDVPRYINKYMKRLEKKNQRKTRTDLEAGMVVVVLCGSYEGKRVILLKSLDNHMVLCSGIREVNQVPIFRIDESCVFPTSTKINIGTVNISVDDVPVVTSDKNAEVMELEYTNQMNKIEHEITKEVEKVDFMKAYIQSDFVIDASKEFYSQKY